MTKILVTIAFIFGLLKFAQDAPSLIKDIFGGASGLFKGVDLNPRGKLLKDAKAGIKTVKDTAAFGKAIGTTARNLTVGAGKGVVGGLIGAAAGSRSGGTRGGLRGLVAGAKAGFNVHGFKNSGFVNATSYAGIGAGAISSENLKSYGGAQSKFKTTFDSMMNLKKNDIQKQKDAKTELEKQYKANLSDYVNTHLLEYYTDENIDAGRELYRQHLADEAFKDEAKRIKRGGDTRSLADIESELRTADTYADLRASIATNALNKESLTSREDIANFTANSDAEKLYKGTYEANKAKFDMKIAELQGEALTGNEGTIDIALSKFQETQKDWGKKISEDYQKALTSNMSKITDKDIAKIINESMVNAGIGEVGTKFAGEGAVGFTTENIQQLAAYINKASTSAEDRKKGQIALSQIMDKMNKAASDTNESVRVATQAYDTYSAASSSNDSKKESGK